MKKSQLRKIIRESIKGLMNEQNVTWDPAVFPQVPVPGQPEHHSFRPCNGTGWQGQETYQLYTGTNNFTAPPCDNPSGPGQCKWVTTKAFYDLAQQPAVGEVVKMMNPNGPFGCYEYMGSTSTHTSGMYNSITNINGYFNTYPSCAACDPTNVAPQLQNCCDPATCCEPELWTGGAIQASVWVYSWIQSPQFTSTNPNQPCNMICKKWTTWTNKCQTAGPVQKNQLACKIGVAAHYHALNNCSTSAAPHCQGIQVQTI